MFTLMYRMPHIAKKTSDVESDDNSNDNDWTYSGNRKCMYIVSHCCQTDITSVITITVIIVITIIVTIFSVITCSHHHRSHCHRHSHRRHRSRHHRSHCHHHSHHHHHSCHNDADNMHVCLCVDSKSLTLDESTYLLLFVLVQPRN